MALQASFSACRATTIGRPLSQTPPILSCPPAIVRYSLRQGASGNSALSGTIHVRLNRSGLPGASSLFPARDLSLTDPFNPGTTDFGGWDLVPLGDVNGDGTTDLAVAVKGHGYVVLVY